MLNASIPECCSSKAPKTSRRLSDKQQSAPVAPLPAGRHASMVGESWEFAPGGVLFSRGRAVQLQRLAGRVVRARPRGREEVSAQRFAQTVLPVTLTLHCAPPLTHPGPLPAACRPAGGVVGSAGPSAAAWHRVFADAILLA
ncbi:hypothetical protein ABPG75_012855 [Micractinium tetrahymenae]